MLGRAGAQHIARDVGGGGRDLIGQAVALRPVASSCFNVRPILTRHIGFAFSLDALRTALRPHDEEPDNQDRKDGDDDQDGVGVEGHERVESSVSFSAADAPLFRPNTHQPVAMPISSATSKVTRSYWIRANIFSLRS